MGQLEMRTHREGRRGGAILGHNVATGTLEVEVESVEGDEVSSSHDGTGSWEGRISLKFITCNSYIVISITLN